MGGAEKGRSQAGVGLTEALVGLAIVGVAAAAAAPTWVEWRQRQRISRAAWTVLMMAEGARLQALRDGRTRALLVSPESEGGVALAVDGDGDGISAADLKAGVDAVQREALRWTRIAEGVRPGGRPATGPGGSRIPGDGVSLPANRASLTPEGTSSSGSLYLTAPGGALATVRWYGPTGRASLWLRLSPEGDWERVR